MKRLALILGLGALMVGSPASANWLKSCQTGATGTLGPGEFVCHNPASADDDPGLLSIVNCENVDIEWFDNITGDGSNDADGTATVYTCPIVASSATDTEAKKLAACQPANNGVGNTLSATVTGLYAMGGSVLWVDVENASTENQLIVKCAQPSAK